MRTGKLTNEQLDELILSKLKHTRKEVICAPSIGVDCTAVELERGIAVLSCDPITAAEENIGRLTVNVSCNDAAAAGAEPIGLMITLLLPPSAELDDVGRVMDEIISAADKNNVDIIGGHTEVTSSVNKIVTCATVIAAPVTKEPITPKGMLPGDDIIMTKHAGLEGALILASKAGKDFLTREEKEAVEAFADQTTVVTEGLYAARHGAHAMHDVTEGGILGALWEMCKASETGISFDKKLIPVKPITRKLSDSFGIDPYKLISSGSMLIAAANGKELVEGLKDLGIEASVIGRAMKRGCECEVFDSEGNIIDPPEADEIYKVC